MGRVEPGPGMSLADGMPTGHISVTRRAGRDRAL
jgi:hypothetical protein